MKKKPKLPFIKYSYFLELVFFLCEFRIKNLLYVLLSFFFVGMAYRTSTSLISAGQHLLLLSSDATVYSYGFSRYGILGHEEESILKPTVIPLLENIKSIFLSGTHSVCLDVDGNVFTFGINIHGQLGVSIDRRSTHIPQKVNLPSCKEVSCGANFTICLSADGFVYSFGYNNYGQLGLGNNENYYSPQINIFIKRC